MFVYECINTECAFVSCYGRSVVKKKIWSIVKPRVTKKQDKQNSLIHQWNLNSSTKGLKILLINFSLFATFKDEFHGNSKYWILTWLEYVS